jgi:hypothetical protein
MGDMSGGCCSLVLTLFCKTAPAPTSQVCVKPPWIASFILLKPLVSTREMVVNLLLTNCTTAKKLEMEATAQCMGSQQARYLAFALKVRSHLPSYAVIVETQSSLGWKRPHLSSSLLRSKTTPVSTHAKRSQRQFPGGHSAPIRDYHEPPIASH